MTFQQKVNVALACHICCDKCGVICVDELCSGDQVREPERLRLDADFPLIANQHRNGNPETQGAIGCCQGNLIVSRHYRNPLGAQRLGMTPQLNEVHYPVAGVGSRREQHDLILVRSGAVLQ